MAIGDGIVVLVTSVNGSGIVVEIPFMCKYLEFTVVDSNYGQYGFCEKDATLPEIQTTGAGRGEFNAYTSPGTYKIDINGTAARYCYLTLNSGHIKDIRLVMF